MDTFMHSYFMTEDEWKQFTDLSGQDERTEFFILLKDEYPELSRHLEDNPKRMEFLKFIESLYDEGMVTPKVKTKNRQK